MPSVSFFTLGCKLNQLETEAIAAEFVKAGFTAAPWDAARLPPDAALLLINTCTVTSKAEQKARRIIRAALRKSPAPLIVTGCYAQLEEEKLAALEREVCPSSAGSSRRLFVIPGAAKERILDLPVFLARAYRACEDRSCGSATEAADFIQSWYKGLFQSPGALGTEEQPEAVNSVFRFNPALFSFHSRAFLKIQDGCDRHCAYCRVPLARGKSRSLDSEEVLSRFRSLEDQGRAEIVLTGVNIVQYRCPRTGKNLEELLGFLLEKSSSAAIRLSSIEPEPLLLSPAFLGVLSQPRIRPHFHLSVQSGSAAVLRAMGRPYRPEDIRESAALLRKVKDDPFLGCDIISGFPGETGEDFEQTYRLCADIGFAWIHGFPYSPRPGTGAYSLKNRVTEEESLRRVGRLQKLARHGREVYVKRWTGKTVEAVAEGKKVPFLSVVTDNYLRVRISGADYPPGTALSCRILRPLEYHPGSFDAAGEIPDKLPSKVYT
jgi:threonylcarbamoyladenosine tRNA methylthiotransferase MtaB